LSVAVLGGKSISDMDHMLHSPDLAPADFRLFPQLKSALKRKRFSDAVDIISGKNDLTDTPVQDFNDCFEQRSKCWEHCKQLERDCLEKF
jgi:hypothetical protein